MKIDSFEITEWKDYTHKSLFYANVKTFLDAHEAYKLWLWYFSFAPKFFNCIRMLQLIRLHYSFSLVSNNLVKEIFKVKFIFFIVVRIMYEMISCIIHTFNCEFIWGFFSQVFVY